MGDLVGALVGPQVVSGATRGPTHGARFAFACSVRRPIGPNLLLNLYQQGLEIVAFGSRPAGLGKKPANLYILSSGVPKKPSVSANACIFRNSGPSRISSVWQTFLLHGTLRKTGPKSSSRHAPWAFRPTSSSRNFWLPRATAEWATL